MIFQFDGTTYDTDDMIEYTTGCPGVPSIFVTRDRSKVFLLTVDRWKGAEIRLAAPSEISFFAQRYNLDDLRNSHPDVQ